MQLILLEQQNKKRLLMARQEQDTEAKQHSNPVHGNVTLTDDIGNPDPLEGFDFEYFLHNDVNDK